MLKPKIPNIIEITLHFSERVREAKAEEMPLSELRVVKESVDEGDFYKSDIRKSIFENCTFTGCTFDKVSL